MCVENDSLCICGTCILRICISSPLEDWIKTFCSLTLLCSCPKLPTPLRPWMVSEDLILHVPSHYQRGHFSRTLDFILSCHWDILPTYKWTIKPTSKHHWKDTCLIIQMISYGRQNIFTVTHLSHCGFESILGLLEDFLHLIWGLWGSPDMKRSFNSRCFDMKSKTSSVSPTMY